MAGSLFETNSGVRNMYTKVNTWHPPIKEMSIDSTRVPPWKMWEKECR